MSFTYKTELEGEVVKVTLSGKLDANSAPELSENLQQFKDKAVKKLVFFSEGLEYISSAGLRVIIFAKQKIGDNADVYFIKAQEFVKEVIDMTGLGNFLIFQDDFTE